MSRYDVDKVLWEVGLGGEQRDQFLRDSEGFLRGRELTSEERRALLQRDYGALYAMGAHHFILWRWASSVDDDSGTLLRRYTESIKPHGYPDYAT